MEKSYNKLLPIFLCISRSITLVQDISYYKLRADYLGANRQIVMI